MSTTVSTVPSAASATKTRDRNFSGQTATVTRAFAETAACEYLILAGCCLLVVMQAPAGREAPSLWFTLWGPLYLAYEYPVQAGVFLAFVGTLRSMSLLYRAPEPEIEKDEDEPSLAA